MSRLINIDDSRNCYIGMDGEYETWNIDPNVIAEAQPERKTGKWMVDPDGRLHCSRCLENPTNRVIINGKLVFDMTPIVGKMRYCPNCGAKMEVE